mmetsp:Transcript_46226/g.108482  ORF Transcript_46226/g.108482 Transcript_46226/m.108482 type:complete len:322 (+) Transcript_46226:485-1450(+)
MLCAPSRITDDVAMLPRSDGAPPLAVERAPCRLLCTLAAAPCCDAPSHSGSDRSTSNSLSSPSYPVGITRCGAPPRRVPLSLAVAARALSCFIPWHVSASCAASCSSVLDFRVMAGAVPGRRMLSHMSFRDLGAGALASLFSTKSFLAACKVCWLWVSKLRALRGLDMMRKLELLSVIASGAFSLLELSLSPVNAGWRTFCDLSSTVSAFCFRAVGGVLVILERSSCRKSSRTSLGMLKYPSCSKCSLTCRVVISICCGSRPCILDDEFVAIAGAAVLSGAILLLLEVLWAPAAISYAFDLATPSISLLLILAQPSSKHNR